MKDMIYREDAIGACAYETIECYEARKAIRALPSAERIGEWIDNEDRYFRCSLCGTKDTDKWNWCHGCGARMRPKLQGTHFDSIIIDECAMKGADDE